MSDSVGNDDDNNYDDDDNDDEKVRSKRCRRVAVLLLHTVMRAAHQPPASLKGRDACAHKSTAPPAADGRKCWRLDITTCLMPFFLLFFFLTTTVCIIFTVVLKN